MPFHLQALSCYECMITMDEEARLFWRKRINGATITYLTNKYLNFAILILSSFRNFSQNSDSVSYLNSLRRIIAVEMSDQ